MRSILVKMLTQWEKELRMLEDWLCHPDIEDDFPKETFMQSKEKFHPKEQLEIVGVAPAQEEAEELAEANLSREMVEQKLSEEAAEFEPAVEWKASAIEGEISMGDQYDLPFDQEEEMQQSRLPRESQPLDQLDKVIEEIREMMLKSTEETFSRRKMNRGEPARAAGQQQQQHRKGADGQAPKRGLGSRRISTTVEEFMRELMIFPAVEYDAGDILPPQNVPSFQHINAHSRRGEAPTLSFFP
jgi:hypothetical protein